MWGQVRIVNHLSVSWLNECVTEAEGKGVRFYINAERNETLNQFP